MSLEDLGFDLDLAGARTAIAPFVRRTPLLRVPELEEPGGAPLYLKLESLQSTGSFKIRGAANRLSALDPEERARGVVACSSGNHGRAVAHIAGLLGVSATLYVPSWVDPVKREGMERAGARVVLAGGSYDEAEAVALAAAEAEGRTFIQPFDDPWVAAGQGTIGIELLEDLPSLGAVLVPLSGGGLAGGTAYALKDRRPDVRVIGVSAARARVMVESVRAGRPMTLEEEPTLAEALSGGIGATNRYTLPLIRALVDEHVVVEEEEIAAAMIFAFQSLRLVVEGGGAVALAAVLARKWESADEMLDGPAAVVISGGNVSLDRLERVLAGGKPSR